MAKLKATHEVISAARTDDGAPVYMQIGGDWTRNLADATPVSDPQQATEMLSTASGQERLVCDPYRFGVVVDGSDIKPVSQREHIRAQGPTTRVRRPD